MRARVRMQSQAPRGEFACAPLSTDVSQLASSVHHFDTFRRATPGSVGSLTHAPRSLHVSNAGVHVPTRSAAAFSVHDWGYATASVGASAWQSVHVGPTGCMQYSQLRPHVAPPSNGFGLQALQSSPSRTSRPRGSGAHAQTSRVISGVAWPGRGGGHDVLQLHVPAK